jgi:hypothetical protein
VLIIPMQVSPHARFGGTQVAVGKYIQVHRDIAITPITLLLAIRKLQPVTPPDQINPGIGQCEHKSGGQEHDDTSSTQGSVTAV